MNPFPPRIPKRILMSADTVGGVWTFALELTRGLAAQEVEVVLATMGAPLTREQAQEASAIPSLEVLESRFKLEWMDEPWRDVAAAGQWLLEVERELQPDLIHLNGYSHGALAWQAPVIVAGHSCVLSWWQAVKGEAAPPHWKHYRESVAAGLRAADLVVAPTRAMLASLEQFYGPLGATRVIPNGRDRSMFQPGVKEDLVLSAGRLWDEAKNVAALAAIAPVLPWPVFVAGDGMPPHGEPAQLPHLHRLGRLSTPELAHWFGRASIYALPARYEPFGFSALEGALACCALVLGDIPSLRELWNDAAVFVPPGDTAALQGALLELMSNREFREKLAARAHRVALELTPQKMTLGYLAAYSEVLQKAQEKELPVCAS